MKKKNKVELDELKQKKLQQKKESEEVAKYLKSESKQEQKTKRWNNFKDITKKIITFKWSKKHLTNQQLENLAFYDRLDTLSKENSLTNDLESEYAKSPVLVDDEKYLPDALIPIKNFIKYFSMFNIYNEKAFITTTFFNQTLSYLLRDKEISNKFAINVIPLSIEKLDKLFDENTKLLNDTLKIKEKAVEGFQNLSQSEKVIKLNASLFND